MTETTEWLSVCFFAFMRRTVRESHAETQEHKQSLPRRTQNINAHSVVVPRSCGGVPVCG